MDGEAEGLTEGLKLGLIDGLKLADSAIGSPNIYLPLIIADRFHL